MSVNSILSFFVNNIVYIIQVVALCLIAIVGIVIYRETIKSDEENSSGVGYSGQLGELEATLKKVLEQTKGQSFSMPIGDGGQIDEVALEAARKEAQEAVQTEIQSLKKQIADKDKLVTELESKAGSSSGPDPELLGQIQDLEARLAEYEIIEDDIADLSIYKEENVRLKEEIAALKAGGAQPVPASTSGDEPVGEVSPEDLAEAEAIASQAASAQQESEPSQQNKATDGDEEEDGLKEAQAAADAAMAAAMADLNGDEESTDESTDSEPVSETESEKPNSAEDVDAIMAAAMAEMESTQPDVVSNKNELSANGDSKTPSDVVDEAVAAALSEGDADLFKASDTEEDTSSTELEAEASFFDEESEELQDSIEEVVDALPVEDPETSEEVLAEESESAVIEEAQESLEPARDDILAEFVAGNEGAASQPIDEAAVQEFAQAGEKPVSKAAPSLDTGIDTSKMMEEMAILNEVAESADGSLGLDESMDVEKMAAEATALDNKN
ncbi:MAG: hypothetical protein KDD61_00880 [Bdellovibrionales bacterium]|nr:hypothetical protein [Bdellovibrionales bacterium]